MHLRLHLLAPLLVLAACAEKVPTYYGDVQPILAQRCVSCHVTGGIAPMPLDSAEAAKAYAIPVRDAVVSRRMPPWLAGPGCATYLADESLSDAQIATLRDWAESDAPVGEPSDAEKSQLQPLEPIALSRADLHLAMPEAYQPTTAPDDYRCFLVPWPEATEQFVTGFRANPGNSRLVHHVIAFLIPPDRVAAYQELDAKEAGAGYTCFGGPGGKNDVNVNWLGAWAPGGKGNDFPAGTGLRVAPGSMIALQVHYNTEKAKPDDSDLTTLDFKLDPTVEKEAVILPFTSLLWVGVFGGSLMSIPRGDPAVKLSFAYDVSEYMPKVTRGVFKATDSFRIHSAALHMHTLGVASRIEILRDTVPASAECLLDIPRWDFGWQRSYPFAEPKVYHPGDRLQISCEWDNSGRLHPAGKDPQDVTWGENTTDEMCLGVLYVSKL